MRRSRVGLLLLAVAAVACDHTPPVDPITERGDLGPFSASPPYRLTFNPGGDLDPSFAGDRIVFSRRPVPQDDSDWCLAFLPKLGGTLLDQSSCPNGGAANGTKDAWLQPRISPNGQRLAFVVETGSTERLSLVPRFRKLVVAPADNPAQAEVLLDFTIGIFSVQGVSGPIPANSLHRLRWLDDENLLFIAGTQRNLTGQFCCDTLYVPIAAVTVNATTGHWEKLDLGPLPPGDITMTASGDLIYTQAEDPAADELMPAYVPDNRIRALGADGTRRVVADFTGRPPVVRVAARGASFVALVEDGTMYSVYPNTGQFTVLGVYLPSTPIEDFAIDPSGSLMVALAGSPSNLWLLEIPR